MKTSVIIISHPNLELFITLFYMSCQLLPCKSGIDVLCLKIQVFYLAFVCYLNWLLMKTKFLSIANIQDVGWSHESDVVYETMYKLFMGGNPGYVTHVSLLISDITWLQKYTFRPSMRRRYFTLKT